jgi:hypothetical protein
MSKFVCLSDTARGLKADSDPTTLWVFRNKGPDDGIYIIYQLYYFLTTEV